MPRPIVSPVYSSSSAASTYFARISFHCRYHHISHALPFSNPRDPRIHTPLLIESQTLSIPLSNVLLLPISPCVLIEEPRFISLHLKGECWCENEAQEREVLSKQGTINRILLAITLPLYPGPKDIGGSCAWHGVDLLVKRTTCGSLQLNESAWIVWFQIRVRENNHHFEWFDSAGEGVRTANGRLSLLWDVWF